MNRTYKFKEKVTRGKPLVDTVSYLLTTFCKFSVCREKVTGTRSVIDGAALRADLFVSPNSLWRNGLFIECKSQNTSGSVHQKLPKLILDVEQGCYPAPLLIVLSGDYFNKSDVCQHTFEWMKSKVDGRNLVAVFNLQDFMTWCERHQGSPHVI